jgi:hypothetical protein
MIACRTASAVAVDVLPSRTAWVNISLSMVRRDTPPRIAMTPKDVKQYTNTRVAALMTASEI